MRKSALGVLALLGLFIGYRVIGTIIAQNSGPFKAYSIKNTTHSEIDSKLKMIETHITTLSNGELFKNYAENMMFDCKKYNYFRKIKNKNGIQFESYKYMTCVYVYGLFGEKIAIRVYLNQQNEVIHADTSNLYAEY